MNYLAEILAFMHWVRHHPISPVLQNYWYWLMFFNNAAAVKGEDGGWYWPVRFTVPNTVLMPLLGMKDRREILRQRSYLCAYNRVDYEKDTHKRAGQYAMIPFDKGLRCRQVTTENQGKCDTVWDKPADQSATRVSPYINVLNNKYTSLLCSTTTAAVIDSGFNLLPALSEAEKAEFEVLYPEDKVGRFEAMWRARERKKEIEN